MAWYGKEGPNSTDHLVDADEWNSQRQPYLTAAGVSVSNTAALTAIFSESISGALFSSVGGLRLRLFGNYLNNDGAGRTLLVSVVFGATTLWLDTSISITNTATQRAFYMTFDLFNISSTSAQALGGFVALSAAGATTGLGDIGTAAPMFFQPIFGTAAEDTTSAKTLTVNVQHSAASANLVLSTRTPILELFPAITASP
jgi:hypothetical protein